MSLCDALLLEPPIPNLALPRQAVWFADRKGLTQGSGTEDDPFDVTPRHLPAVQVLKTQITYSGRQATFNISHNYHDGDVVTISGVTGAGADQFNGSFPIYDSTAGSFNYWMEATPAAGADGSAITCAKMTFPFDDLMLALRENSLIRLGPGVICTRGAHDDAPGSPWQHWKPKNGQRIVGSGMDVTTLKIVFAEAPNEGYSAIGINHDERIRDFQVSDLTIDANLPNQPPTPASKVDPSPPCTHHKFARLTCSGIFLLGWHIRIRRVRVINFGTQGFGDKNDECFVIFTGGMKSPGHPEYEALDCVVEDCVIEQPAMNNTRETTCIHLSGGTGCVIRHCRVDCGYADGISSHVNIVNQLTHDSDDGDVATMTTRSPHNHQVGDLIRVWGAKERDPQTGDIFPSEKYNSPVSCAFEVIEWVSAYQLKYRMVGTPVSAAEGAIFSGVNFQAYAADGGAAAVIEGNYARQVSKGVFHDSNSSRELIVRDNFFTDLAYGVKQSLPEPETSITPAVILRNSGLLATLVPDLPDDDAVRIIDALPKEFRGVFRRAPDASTPGTFNYYLVAPAPTDGDAINARYVARWQERHIVIENNVFELAPALAYGAYAINLDGGSRTAKDGMDRPNPNAPYAFCQVVVRGNVIRHPAGVTDRPGMYYSGGVLVTSAENLVVENNLIDAEAPIKILLRDIGKARLFNNRTMAGVLLDGQNDSQLSQQWTDGAREIQTMADLALLLSS